MKRASLMAAIAFLVPAAPAAAALPPGLWRLPSLTATPPPAAPAFDGEGRPRAGQPVLCSPGATFDARRLVGLSLPLAKGLAWWNRCTMRVKVIDGRQPLLTADLRLGRLNVAVRDGVVTRIVDLG